MVHCMWGNKEVCPSEDLECSSISEYSPIDGNESDTSLSGSVELSDNPKDIRLTGARDNASATTFSTPFLLITLKSNDWR